MKSPKYKTPKNSYFSDDDKPLIQTSTNFLSGSKRDFSLDKNTNASFFNNLFLFNKNKSHSTNKKFFLHETKNMKFSKIPNQFHKIFNNTPKINHYKYHSPSPHRLPETIYQKMSKEINDLKNEMQLNIKVMRKKIKISDREILYKRASSTNFFSTSKIFNSTKLNSSVTQKENELINKNIEKEEGSIKNNTQKIFPKISLNNNNKFEKLHHIRKFELTNKAITTKIRLIYNSPLLFGISSYIKQPIMQLNLIYNKIKLILDNINYFKINYLNKNDFSRAVANMDNKQKAKLNSIIEEISGLLIKMIPLLLKTFYESLDQLLFINIPKIDLESQNIPLNEFDCFKLNMNFYARVTDYFSACVDIFDVIHKQISDFSYEVNEFNKLNSMLDLARYDTSSLIAIAKNFINKRQDDQNIFIKFEEGLNLRKKKDIKNEKSDGLKKFHYRHNFKIMDDNLKISRINCALSFFGDGHEDKGKSIKKKDSIFESDVINNIAKYAKTKMKKQIISQRIIERYRKKELKRLGKNGEESSDDD